MRSYHSTPYRRGDRAKFALTVSSHVSGILGYGKISLSIFAQILRFAIHFFDHHMLYERKEGRMEQTSIYGSHLPDLIQAQQELLSMLEEARGELAEKLSMDPVEHCLSRIKSEESMREKCRRKGLPETPESALSKVHDAIGVRIVCAFIDDIYALRDAIAEFSDCEIITEKDYIRHAKPNGYRSYHMILLLHGTYYAEVQLRTISMDTWAALEHHMKYKKAIGGNTELIVGELKRCADELASTDVSMQTIRNLILEQEE